MDDLADRIRSSTADYLSDRGMSAVEYVERTRAIGLLPHKRIIIMRGDKRPECPPPKRKRKKKLSSVKNSKFKRSLFIAIFGYECAYCGKEFEHKDLTIDHVIPRAKGGNDGYDNLVLACKPCNDSKGIELWTPRYRYVHAIHEPMRIKILEGWEALKLEASNRDAQ